MLDPSFSACRAGEIELGFEPTSVNRGSEGSVLNRQSTELGRIRACQRKQGGERPLARSRGPRPNSGGTGPNGGTSGPGESACVGSLAEREGAKPVFLTVHPDPPMT